MCAYEHFVDLCKFRNKQTHTGVHTKNKMKCMTNRTALTNATLTFYDRLDKTYEEKMIQIMRINFLLNNKSAAAMKGCHND